MPERGAIAEHDQRARQAQFDQQGAAEIGVERAAGASGHSKWNAAKRDQRGATMSNLIEAPAIARFRRPSTARRRSTAGRRWRSSAPPIAAPADGRASAGRARAGGGDRSSAAGLRGGRVASVSSVARPPGSARWRNPASAIHCAPSDAADRLLPPPPRKIASRWGGGLAAEPRQPPPPARRRGARSPSAVATRTMFASTVGDRRRIAERRACGCRAARRSGSSRARRRWCVSSRVGRVRDHAVEIAPVGREAPRLRATARCRRGRARGG